MRKFYLLTVMAITCLLAWGISVSPVLAQGVSDFTQNIKDKADDISDKKGEDVRGRKESVRDKHASRRGNKGGRSDKHQDSQDNKKHDGEAEDFFDNIKEGITKPYGGNGDVKHRASNKNPKNKPRPGSREKNKRRQYR